MARPKVTIHDVQKAKEDKRKLVMITAYDYPFGLMADEAEVDIVLVGDSLGMVVMGLQGTVAVTMENMVHHIQAVMRGCKTCLVVGDMPFMSYNTSIREAIINAGRLVKDGGCDVVKLEGGRALRPDGRGHRQGRHPGPGAHRAHPADRQRAGRLQDAGQGRLGRQADHRRRPGARGRRGLLDHPGGRAGAAGQAGGRSRCGCR